MMHLDPKWHWMATFTDGATITFMADTKALAQDHAETLGRDFKRVVRTVKRIGHVNGMTRQDQVHLGALYEPF